MPVRAKRDVEAALKKKGFQQDDGDHHWFFYWTSDGKKTTVRTKTSHGSTKDLVDGLLKEMARRNCNRRPWSSASDIPYRPYHFILIVSMNRRR